MWNTDNRYFVKPTRRFKRQYKKLKYSGNVDISELDNVIDILASGENLPDEYYPHKLDGQLKGYWGCHISSDWVLLYSRNADILVLTLYSTGNHEEGYSLD